MATLNLGHVVGPGVPTGGSTGQVLKKSSATNFATTWANVNDLTEISNIHNAIGIVVNGKQASVGASIGQYVILKNSTITGKTDGLYTAAKAIPANTDIDSTYLTAVSNGGLNAINSNITTINTRYINNNGSWTNDGNANSYTNSGIYAVGSGWSNIPSWASYGILEVYAPRTDCLNQVITATGPRKAFREFRSGEWTNWEELALNSKLTGDNGWTTINFTYPTYYRKVAGIVFVIMRLNGGSTPTDGELLGTLPEGYRPTLNFVSATHNLRGNLSVSTDGKIIVSANNDQSLNNYMGCEISYPV